MGAMVLLVTIIKDYRKIEEILLGFVEYEVLGATVLEGRGMGQIIGDVPIFASLRGLFPGSAERSNVLLAVMSRAKARRCTELVNRIAGPLDQPGTGVVFQVPIEGMLGGARPISESPNDVERGGGIH
jgi:nitrogen regulatory protein P-II 1